MHGHYSTIVHPLPCVPGAACGCGCDWLTHNTSGSPLLSVWLHRWRSNAACPPARRAGPQLEDGCRAVVLSAIENACAALEAAEPQLTEWDSVAGDGDCGLTMKRGAQTVRDDMEAYALLHPAVLLGQLADSVRGPDMPITHPAVSILTEIHLCHVCSYHEIESVSQPVSQ
jgi:hypothetical protein